MEYSIVNNQILQQRLIALEAEAAVWGQDATFRAAFRFLLQQIRHSPFQVGEILYRTNNGVPVHKAALAPVLLTFAIYEQPRLVWILGMARMCAAGE